MASLNNIFGGEFSLPQPKIPDSPESQLRKEMMNAGLTPPEHIYLDGKIHRFNSGTKGSPGHSKPGWYCAFGDGIPSGRFGCWRSGIEVTFRADMGRQYTAEEEIIHQRRMSEAKAIRDAELERSHDIAANTVEKIWTECQAASNEHPYLVRKGIKVNGARITGDGRLIVPLYHADGSLASLQYISHDGTKLYHPGGQTGGKYWMIGTDDEPGALYIAEGFATAATIYEVTSRPCIVAYSASNIVPVTGILRERYGAGRKLIIIADNDASGVGQKYADQASAKYGATVIMPPDQGDANDYVQAGGDLYSLLHPKVEQWLIPANEFCAQPSPVSWLVKGWLQDQALIMVHGPSGGGKTFIVLDWCLRMASGITEWMGNKVRNGTVIYLAGEGHHGLRGRIAAWKQHHQVQSIDMWLSRDGCDLNTPSGYQRVVDNIREIKNRPSLIIVDTLHRFLMGDENSAQDAKSMLDACNALMNEFKCSVGLVHHTGVADEAQHRARGSSAWRGALDIEISIVPGETMEIIQRKSKDAELAKSVFVELESVPINGWFDEDGEPVSSAVIVESEESPRVKNESKIAGHFRNFENAWFKSGAEIREHLPYLTRSALLDYVVENMGIKENSAKVYISPSQKGKVIHELLIAEIIRNFENGWLVIDDIFSSQMMLKKSSVN